MAIKPEDLLRNLEAKSAGAGPPDSAAANIAKAGVTPASGVAAIAKEESVVESISASYYLLRRGLAIMALAFPIVLWLGAGGGGEDLLSSISSYYHYRDMGSVISPYGGGAMRDVFVGILWAVGAFLFFYKGYSRREDWALDIAGVAAILIAICPMDWPGEPPSRNNIIHNTATIFFFLAVAYVCLFRSGDTLRLMKDGERQRRFKRAYSALGTLMILLPLSILAIHLLADQFHMLPERADESRFILAIEVAAIWVFATFWLVKSREVAILEKQ